MKCFNTPSFLLKFIWYYNCVLNHSWLWGYDVRYDIGDLQLMLWPVYLKSVCFVMYSIMFKSAWKICMWVMAQPSLSYLTEIKVIIYSGRFSYLTWCWALFSIARLFFFNCLPAIWGAFLILGVALVAIWFFCQRAYSRSWILTVSLDSPIFPVGLLVSWLLILVYL